MSRAVAQMVPPGVTLYTNRADYLSKTGKQAPPCRSDIPLRFWAGPNVDGSYPAYQAISGQLKALVPKDAIPPVASKLNPLMIAFLGPQDAAGGVNLPGAYSYVNWEEWRLRRASSAVTVTLSLFGAERTQGVAIEALFTTSEAKAVADEIGQGAQAVEATDWNGVPAKYNYPPEEKRRVWSVLLPGQRIALSALFRQRTDSPAGNTQNGIGSNGQWLVTEAGVTWKGLAPDLGEGRTDEVAVPSVPLADDEEIAIVPNGLVFTVVVRKRGETSAPPVAPVAGGGLSAADAQKLLSQMAEVWAGMKLLVERSGG